MLAGRPSRDRNATQRGRAEETERDRDLCFPDTFIMTLLVTPGYIGWLKLSENNTCISWRNRRRLNFLAQTMHEGEREREREKKKRAEKKKN